MTDNAVLHLGDCLEVMRTLPDCSVDAIVTDLPYALTQNKKGETGAASVNLDNPYGKARIGTGNGSGGFMGKAWDSELPTIEMWQEALRVAKPGAHMLAFGGTRTFYRLACAIEDAGWEIRDTVMWVYGSGFPKSLNVQQAMNKAERGHPQGSADPTSPNSGKFKGGCSEDNEAGRGFGAGAGAYMKQQGRGRGDDVGPWQGWGTAAKSHNLTVIYE